MKFKAVLMAGGTGQRLRPLTLIINKHLLPVYNKPMFFYSLTLLELSGVHSVLIITNSAFIDMYKKVINDGYKGKIKIYFKVQEHPAGIADCFRLSKDFLKNENKFILLLGDNFFYGRDIHNIINKELFSEDKKSVVLLSPVKNPSNFGIANFNNKNSLEKIIEKPKKSKSNLAVTGLYIYHKSVFQISKKIKKSRRGELEISSINDLLIKNKNLRFILLGRGTTWFDMGSYSDLFNASEFVKIMEERQGLEIGSPLNIKINTVIN
jgi:glucose-1-phosphate thymidylyltransferase